MRVYLEKKLKKNIEFCLLEVDGEFLNSKKGIVGKSSSTITKKFKNNEALLEFKNLVDQYKNNGFEEKGNESVEETIVFDKAKWHYNGDFPVGLDENQAYVHTGFYIEWLIKNNLISEYIDEEFKELIDKIKNNELDGVDFYKNQLDGVFTSDELNKEGLLFTKFYFDFDNGKFLHDYEQELASNEETIYHVKGNRENYKKISAIINNRFDEWKSFIN